MTPSAAKGAPTTPTRALLFALAVLFGCSGRWVPGEEAECPPHEHPAPIVVGIDTAWTTAVRGRLFDAATEDPLKGAHLILSTGAAADTIILFEGTFDEEVARAGPVVLRFVLIGYGTREDTVFVRAGQVLRLDVPMNAMAVDGCGFGTVMRWKPWWQFW